MKLGLQVGLGPGHIVLDGCNALARIQIGIVAMTTVSKSFGYLTPTVSFLCWSRNVIIFHHGMFGQFGWNAARHCTTTEQ